LFMSLQMATRYLWINGVGLLINVAGNAVFTLSSGASAAARVSYVTELAVVALASAPLGHAGSRGAALKALAICAVAIAGAEVYAAGWSSAPVAAAIVIVVSGALAARELTASTRRLMAGRASP